MWRMLINTPNREPLYFFYFEDKHFFLSFFFLVLLEKTRECPLDIKEIKAVHPKGNQLWIFIRRTDAEADIPILWSHDAKSWLIVKDPDSGKDWRQKKKRVAEDKMVRYHHWLSEHEFEQTPGDSKVQGSLVCCSTWGYKELDTTWQLNNRHALQEIYLREMI